MECKSREWLFHIALMIERLASLPPSVLVGFAAKPHLAYDVLAFN